MTTPASSASNPTKAAPAPKKVEVTEARLKALEAAEAAQEAKRKRSRDMNIARRQVILNHLDEMVEECEKLGISYNPHSDQ